ncbi:MAG TPA: hypothetical protein VFW22_12410 [Pseudolabrys sp.]|nr:hypothetical protein [Pseudolabrys sp.]
MDIDTHTELETKAGVPLDAVVTHSGMMRALEGDLPRADCYNSPSSAV